MKTTTNTATKRPRVAVAIQARSDSRRLPLKVLRRLDAGRDGERVTMLRAVWQRAYAAAVSEDEPQIIIPHCDRALSGWLRGCYGAAAWWEDPRPDKGYDVLGRYVEWADGERLADGDWIVRLTADCPLVPPDEVARVVDAALDADTGVALVANCWGTHRTVYDGWDVEVMRVGWLRRAHKEQRDSGGRQHVTWAAHDCIGGTAIHVGRPPEMAAYPDEEPWAVKLSVDTQDDYDRVSRLAGMATAGCVPGVTSMWRRVDQLAVLGYAAGQHAPTASAGAES